MGSELGLDLKLSATRTVGGLLKEASTIDGGVEAKMAKLEDFVRSLEEERRKIDAFKRELPLCMLLLNDVIGGLKDELEQCRSDDRYEEAAREFMPIKRKFEEEGEVKLEKDHSKDKMNWMSSAQLWSDNYSDVDNTKSDNNSNEKKNSEETVEESDRRQESENPSLESKPKSGGGAFVPFKGLSAIAMSSKKEEKVAMGLPDLSLLAPVIKASRPLVGSTLDNNRCGVSVSKVVGRCQAAASPAGGHLGLQQAQLQQLQSSRKARRCWSPELHRRFVVALQQLGGAQVATPKQIRELMKVDGLTNDEVKSHLQKYRLHTRRVPNSSSSAQPNRPVVVMGSLWVPQDHYTTSQQSASQSGSPQGPLQLAGSSRALSVTAADSCEEDGRSESYSCK